MLRDFFGNISPVCKNLLILNVIMFVFIATGGTSGFGYERNQIFGMYYFASPEFKPYQIVTHMFSHGSVPHLVFNMFSLVMFGSLLERIWGPKRFLLFYLVTGLGAVALHEAVNAFQVYKATGSLAPDIYRVGDMVHAKSAASWMDNREAFNKVASAYFTPVVGASGAIFGLLIAFAMLFPNTELMLLLFPVPIKAKYFVPILVVAELLLAQANFEADNVAHYAHLGGALFGFILVRLWQRNRNKFY